MLGRGACITGGWKMFRKAWEEGVLEAVCHGLGGSHEEAIGDHGRVARHRAVGEAGEDVHVVDLSGGGELAARGTGER